MPQNIVLNLSSLHTLCIYSVPRTGVNLRFTVNPRFTEVDELLSMQWYFTISCILDGGFSYPIPDVDISKFTVSHSGWRYLSFYSRNKMYIVIPYRKVMTDIDIMIYSVFDIPSQIDISLKLYASNTFLKGICQR